MRHASCFGKQCFYTLSIHAYGNFRLLQIHFFFYVLFIHCNVSPFYIFFYFLYFFFLNFFFVYNTKNYTIINKKIKKNIKVDSEVATLQGTNKIQTKISFFCISIINPILLLLIRCRWPIYSHN